MLNATLRGKPDAGSPHVRFDEGEVAPAKSRRGSLPYKKSLLVSALLLAGCGLWADVVTNDYFGDITSPTTLRGVTNIIAKTQDVNISADLTLDDRTFLWIRGDSGTGYINLAPTAADATLTVQGNSGFFAAYRYSGDGNQADSDWGKVGIDELNKNTPKCFYRLRIGTPNGAPGSTGCGKIVVKTNPAFGYNAFGGIWSRYLYVETSPRPDPATGYLDILDIENGATADISQIENKSTVTPARILFRGGMLLRNNATSVDAPLAPAEGATLVLWSVDDAEILLKKQYANSDFTGRKGGSVRIVGKDLRLTSSGCLTTDSGANFWPWKLAASDHVIWELGGDITLAENAWLLTENNDLLPYGPGTGRVILGYNGGVKEANVATQAPYCCLDLFGTEQHLNGVTSTGGGYRIGVITNTHESATGTLVLGAQNVGASLNAKCTARVVVVKEGTGALAVDDATGEALTISSGSAAFAGTSVFTNLTAAAGVTLEGTVGVRSQGVFGAGVSAEALNLALDADATLSVEGSVDVLTLTRAGAAVASGVYPAATTDWVEAGTVRVLLTSGAPVEDINWTGAGATTSASLAANWSDGDGAFSLPRGRPVFATTGTEAVLDSGISHFTGLKFAAPGDFTVVTNGPSDAVNLYGSLEVTRPESEEPTVAHTYTLAAPVKFCADQTITLATNMSVRLLGGIASASCYGLTYAGVRLSDMANDYLDQGSDLILENPRISGPITHTQGGGWLTLRGDVGNPGDTAAINLDYIRYRNGKNSSDGFMNGGLTRVENATIWKPVSISGQGHVGGLSLGGWFVCGANTTNVFKELVTCAASTAITAESDAVAIFEKGVRVVTWGGFNPKSLDINRPGTFIFNGSVRLDSTSRHFDPSSASRIVFNSAGNYARFCLQSNAGVFDFNVDDAFADTGFVLNHTDATLNFGATHQRMAWLISGKITMTNSSCWFADNYACLKRGTITGTYPSALEITCGAPTEDACSVTNCGVQFTGWVGLEKSGAGWHRMLSMAYQSFGDVEVSGGTLLFDAGATWLNGTNVTVKGTGTLKLGSGGTFQDQCFVATEGEAWTLDLTGNQKAYQFTVDGQKMPGGVYGAATLADAHPLKARFAGPGALIVRATGTLLLFH